MKIAIVGSGAIGSYYGTKLALGGHDVHFLVRRNAEELRRSGILLRHGEEEAHLPDPQCNTDPGKIGPCDLVIIALKTTQNEALPKLVPPLLGEETWLLTLQNGLGPDEFLAGYFDSSRIFGGLCFIALNRVRPTLVERYSAGYLTLGEFDRPSGVRAERLAELFRECGVNAATAPSLLEARWRKLIWNVPFNGLGVAAGGVDTQTILEDEALFSQVRPLMDEIRAGAAAYDIHIEDALLDKQLERTHAMKKYRPSSVVDFLEGREVEVEPLWGEPLRRSRNRGLELPRLALLYGLIRRVCIKSFIPGPLPH